MKKLTTLLLIVFTNFCCISVIAQSEDEMKAMMAYSTPGEIHGLLAKSTGTWTGAITMWMQPGAPPTNSTGEAKNEMILGGRYLQSKNTGNFMGMPFEGIGVTGYDNAKKIFVNSWIDNMGTGIMHLEGPWDAKSKSINLAGKMVDPSTGKDIPVREVMKFVDDNNQVMEMYYVLPDGKEFKSMEIKYTKKS
jgi:hypothetical protein